MLGSLFAQNDKLLLKNGKYYNVKYQNIFSDGRVQIQIFDNGSITSTSFDLDEIDSLILEDGSIIIKSDSNAKTDSNPSYHLINSSKHLIKFKSEYYAGAGISFLAGLSTYYGITNKKDEFINFGSLASMIGNIMIFFSYSEIGKAGVELEKAGKELQKSRKKEKSN